MNPNYLITLQKKNNKFILIGYMDADYGVSLDDRRSTTRYVFFFGSGPISWGSKKQSITCKSTIKLEYCVATDDVCEAIWLHCIFTNIGIPQNQPTVLYCDNRSVLKMVRNHVFHECTKCIEIGVHFIYNHVSLHNIQLFYISTKEQTVDVFTKSLDSIKFEYIRGFQPLI